MIIYATYSNLYNLSDIMIHYYVKYVDAAPSCTNLLIISELM